MPTKTAAKKTSAPKAQAKPSGRTARVGDSGPEIVASPKTAAAPSTETADGYVWVSRTITTIEGDEDRAPGYVHIPGEEQPRLVDAKSVPELEVLGYLVVDAPKNDDED